MILNIETSTSVCSVALSENGNIIDEKTSYEKNSHSKLLAGFVDDIFKENGDLRQKLEAIAVSEGPGSYTGLRIGVSMAKGLAFALDIPMIAIDTLLIMSTAFLDKYSTNVAPNTVLVPMIDARRMEVYTAFFDMQLNKFSETTNMIIDEFSFQTPLQTVQMAFFGDGAAKCKDVIKHENAFFVDDIFPLARYMAKAADEKLKNKDFVDTAYFEPFYLKPFIATTPKNKLI